MENDEVNFKLKIVLLRVIFFMDRNTGTYSTSPEYAESLKYWFLIGIFSLTVQSSKPYSSHRVLNFFAELHFFIFLDNSHQANSDQ